MHDLLPASAEGWAFYGLVFTTVSGGVGWLVNWWVGRKVAAANAVAKASADAATATATLQQRIIDGAERREQEANKREMAALAGMTQLTNVTNELTMVNKITHEEVRRVNANCDILIRAASTLEALLRERR